MSALDVLPDVTYNAPCAETATNPRDRQMGWAGSQHLAVLCLDRNLVVDVRLPDFNGVDQPMGRVPGNIGAPCRIANPRLVCRAGAVRSILGAQARSRPVFGVANHAYLRTPVDATPRRRVGYDRMVEARPSISTGPLPEVWLRPHGEHVGRLPGVRRRSPSREARFDLIPVFQNPIFTRK